MNSDFGSFGCQMVSIDFRYFEALSNDHVTLLLRFSVLEQRFSTRVVEIATNVAMAWLQIYSFFLQVFWAFAKCLSSSLISSRGLRCELAEERVDQQQIRSIGLLHLCSASNNLVDKNRISVM